MLSMIPTILTELIEDRKFFYTRGVLITSVDCLKVFFFRSWTHNHVLLGEKQLGNIYYESTILT